MKNIFTLILLLVLVSCGTSKKAVTESTVVKDTTAISSSVKTNDISQQVKSKDSTGSVKHVISELDYFKATPIDPEKPSVVIDASGKELKFYNATVEYGKKKKSKKEKKINIKAEELNTAASLKEDKLDYNHNYSATNDITAIDEKDTSAVTKNIKSTVLWIVILFFVLLIIIYYIRHRLLSKPADDHTFL